MMQFSPFLILVVLAFAAVFAAGCTQGTGPVITVLPVPVTTPHLQDLALNTSDVPACFSLTKQNIKSPDDVGSLAKDLGWQAGYVVSYTCSAQSPEPTVITHSLAVYPAENMPGIAFMVDKQDRSAIVAYENLSFTDQTIAVRGFYGKAEESQFSPESPGTFVLNGGHDESGENTESESNVAEIIIYRGTTFEVLRMTGPKTNITLLRDLTHIAGQKIP
jgi:hypothetical protein